MSWCCFACFGLGLGMGKQQKCTCGGPQLIVMANMGRQHAVPHILPGGHNPFGNPTLWITAGCGCVILESQRITLGITASYGGVILWDHTWPRGCEPGITPWWQASRDPENADPIYQSQLAMCSLPGRLLLFQLPLHNAPPHHHVPQ